MKRLNNLFIIGPSDIHDDDRFKVKALPKITNVTTRKSGVIGWWVLWLIGVPIPVLLILFLIRGCT